MAVKENGVKGWEIVRTALSKLAYNPDDVLTMLAQHPDNFHVKVGRCIYHFMDALLLFSDEKFEEVAAALKETEKECASDVGWLQAMKKRVFRTEETSKDYITKWEKQILLADLHVCSAILMIFGQKCGTFMRGLWTFHSAWRLYQQAYTEILKLYQRTFGKCPVNSLGSKLVLPTGCSTPPSKDAFYTIQSSQSTSFLDTSTHCCSTSKSCATPIPPPSGLRSSLSMFFSPIGFAPEQQAPFVEPTEVSRLMAAASFGYGIYQLCVALLPSPLRRMMECLCGLEGDKATGFAALTYTHFSEDMHAPLATVALLLYYLLLRPIISDEKDLEFDLTATKQLITEWNSKYNDPTVTSFLTARVNRLEGKLVEAIDGYEETCKMPIRKELRRIIKGELVFVNLSAEKYEQSYQLIKYTLLSRRSPLLYPYLATVCCGLMGKPDDFLEAYRKMQRKIAICKGPDEKLPSNHFSIRRTSALLDPTTQQPYSTSYYKIFLFEILYAYYAMECCSKQTLEELVSDCKSVREKESVPGLTDLIEGTAHRYLGNSKAAIKCYEDCLERRESCTDNFDQHINVIALFELGLLLYKTNIKSNMKKGKQCIAMAQRRYTNYPFQAQLRVRIDNRVLVID